MKVTSVKHIAIAVKDVEQAVRLYQRLLGAGDPRRKEMSLARTREAHLNVGGVEFQLIEPMPGEHRYSDFMEAHNGEGVHHICYTVDNIDEALREVTAAGATLSPCKSHKVVGSHKHFEGWVAFLQDTAAGLEIEFMQVYGPGEGPDNPIEDV